MKLVTSEQMREIEKISITEYGIPSVVLMENASIAFCNELNKNINLSNKKICICCGKGNNGGDGFAIGRHLTNMGYDVYFVLAFDESKSSSLLSSDAFTNYSIIKNMNIPTFSSYEKINGCDICIDALLGTGIKGAPKEPMALFIDAVNNSGAYICSVDIPSGADASTGAVCGACVNADLTISFAFAKVGHYVYPAKEFSGNVSVCPISIPKNVTDDYDSNFYVLTDNVFSLLPERKSNSHKGTFGKVLACVGSDGMSGAAILSVSAAFKSGVGMVTAASTEGTLKNILLSLPETMTFLLGSSHQLDDIEKNIEKNDVLLLGCGISRSDTMKTITHSLVASCKKPMVIDADGINNLSENTSLLLEKKAPAILTPHTVEFSRLTGLSPAEIEKNRLIEARRFSEKYDVVLVLKGADTIICSPCGKTYICPISNSGMATAGSGDVLSGIIAGFLAQGADTLTAAAAGVYAHSLAGKYAADSLGVRCMTASDILSNISSVMKKIK